MFGPQLWAPLLFRAFPQTSYLHSSCIAALKLNRPACTVVLESFGKGDAPGSAAMPACIVLERWDYSLSDWNNKMQRQPDDVELKSALYMVSPLCHPIPAKPLSYAPSTFAFTCLHVCMAATHCKASQCSVLSNVSPDISSAHRPHYDLGCSLSDQYFAAFSVSCLLLRHHVL